MRLFQFTLPRYDNAGRRLATAHKNWATFAGLLCGGITVHAAAEGQWYDDAGKLYREPVIAYTVALTEEDAPDHFDKLLAEAFTRFPDQLAIFTAELGSARVYNRGKA